MMLWRDLFDFKYESEMVFIYVTEADLPTTSAIGYGAAAPDFYYCLAPAVFVF